MLPITIGGILIFLGCCLISIGYSDLKKELEMVKGEKSVFKRLIVYVITCIGFLDFDSYIGWILSLALLLIFSGGAFILLTVL